MDPRDLLHGLTPRELVQLTGTSLASARRWVRSRQIPPLAKRLLELVRERDLGYVDPAWQGWKLLRKKIVCPDGNEASQGQIRAIRARLAQITELERALREPAQRELFPM